MTQPVDTGPKVLILSTQDPSVIAVDERLRAMGIQTLHLTDEDPIVDFEVQPDTAWMRTRSGTHIVTDDVDASWIHRGALVLSLPSQPQSNSAAVKAGWDSVRALVRHLLAQRPCLGDFRPPQQRRLSHLATASRAGFSVPETYVVHSAQALDRVLVRHPGSIVKPLADGVAGGTRPATADLWSGQPLLVQAFVPKRADIRVFYLDGQTFSMALHPLSEAAAIDHRPAGLHGSRAVPYQLPDGVAGRVRTFMDGEGLDTGSLDLVLTPNSDHVFLEVNPAGQFAALSRVCGYDLEGRVARALADRAGRRGPPAAGRLRPAPLERPLMQPAARPK